MAADAKRPARRWFVHIELTPIIIVLAVAGIGWFVHDQFQNYRRREALVAAKLRDDLEAKEAALRQEEARADAVRRETEASARKDALAREARVRAEWEQRRQELLKQSEEHQQKVENKMQASDNQLHAAIAEAIRNKEDAAARRTQQYILATKETCATILKEIRALEAKILAWGEPYIGPTNPALDALGHRIGIAQSALRKHYRELNAAAGNAELERTINDQILSVEGELASAHFERRKQQLVLYSEGKDSDTKKRLESELMAARLRLDVLTTELQRSGDLPLPYAPLPPPRNAPEKAAVAKKEPVPEAPPKPATPETVYVLKSGKRIIAVRSVESGDAMTVKTDDGKFVTIEKSDIERTEKGEPDK
ncbi:MAG TPA: hypothetical protein VGP72_21730 [Planctomycetota bacterium]|jgi:hypothetical protein